MNTHSNVKPKIHSQPVTAISQGSKGEEPFTHWQSGINIGILPSGYFCHNNFKSECCYHSLLPHTLYGLIISQCIVNVYCFCNKLILLGSPKYFNKLLYSHSHWHYLCTRGQLWEIPCSRMILSCEIYIQQLESKCWIKSQRLANPHHANMWNICLLFIKKIFLLGPYSKCVPTRNIVTTPTIIHGFAFYGFNYP